MWTAEAFVDGAWAQIEVIPIEGEPFSSSHVRGVARERLTPPPSLLINHLDNESDTTGRFARDAIEFWSRSAEEESNEFEWAHRNKIVAIEEAIGLYFSDDPDTITSSKPHTLAWHDHTAVIIPLKGNESRFRLRYTPSLRDENRIERLRHRYGGPDHVLETFFDWRGYFGKQSTILDGWSKMRSAGHGYFASIKGAAGFVVGSILRRLTRPQPTLKRDPTAMRRLVGMSERYPNIANGCPDLSKINGAEHPSVQVFIHGTVSCGIQGLKDLYPDSVHPIPYPTYRYEHDTFCSLDENATELAELISNRIRAQRILVVGHSRGGLVARLAVHKLLRQGQSGEIEIATFGTPHLGTPLVHIGGRALNLLFKLGEDIVGSLPGLSPLVKAYSYLMDAPTLPRGIDAMREDSDLMDLLRDHDDPSRLRSYGSNFDITTAPSGFAVVVEGALLGMFRERFHDLVVPIEFFAWFRRSPASINLLSCALLCGTISQRGNTDPLEAISFAASRWHSGASSRIGRDDR